MAFRNCGGCRRRPDVLLIHSIYVDQWDWERIIRKEDRTLDFLKSTVRVIFLLVSLNPFFVPDQPRVSFCIDARAADYDDWTTPTGEGRFGLNGDIIVWDEIAC